MGRIHGQFGPFQLHHLLCEWDRDRQPGSHEPHDRGIEGGTTYTLRVYAKDTAGNQSKSSNVVTVTLPGQIAAPTKPLVTLLDVGPTHATLGWSSTDDGPTIWYTIFIDGQQVSTLNSKASTFTCAAVMVPTYCVPINQATTYTFTVPRETLTGTSRP